MEVIIYSKTVCPYCVQAKQYLSRNGIEYTEKNLDNDDERTAFYALYPGVRSVPQIFFGTERIGGYQELVKSDLVARYNLAKGDFNEDF
jgi:glutaredoxin 3